MTYRMVNVQIQEQRLHERRFFRSPFFLCLKAGFKGLELEKVGKHSTGRQTFTEEQEKLISELTSDLAGKFREAFTNLAAKSHCTGRNLPGVMDSKYM